MKRLGIWMVFGALCLAADEKPVALRPGDAAPAFAALTMDGKAVHFPADFKGKVILLDFWATWCPDCIGYIPSTVDAYQKYHGRGFEVLGISLDEPDSAGKIKSFTGDNKMTWPQVYEGKHEENRMAKLYGVVGIPHPFLVDGDSGNIIATGDDAEGDALGPNVEKALNHRDQAGNSN